MTRWGGHDDDNDNRAQPDFLSFAELHAADLGRPRRRTEERLRRLSEVLNVPAPAFGIRGGDIDSNCVVRASLSSGHLGVRGPLNGPNATGNHCPGVELSYYPGSISTTR